MYIFSSLFIWFFPSNLGSIFFLITSSEGFLHLPFSSGSVLKTLLPYSIAVVCSRNNNLKWFLRKKYIPFFLLLSFGLLGRGIIRLQLTGWVWARRRCWKELQVDLCLLHPSPARLPGHCSQDWGEKAVERDGAWSENSPWILPNQVGVS